MGTSPAWHPGPMPSEEDLAEVAATRASMAAEAADEPGEEVRRVTDLTAGGVPCRLYEPDHPEGTGGLLVFFHGGGFVFGDLDTHDAHCRLLADRTGWAVLAVHYRRAPEHPYPAAVQDAETVTVWLATQPAELAGVPGPRAVSGDSAGANLALGVSLRHRGLYDAQVLVYPFLDPSCATYDRTISDPDFGVEDLAWFWRLYIQGADTAEVDLDPLRAADFAGLPRTLVQLAALDVLSVPGRQLAARLAEDGVRVSIATYPGVGHGFWRHDDNDQRAPALADLAAFLAA